MHSMAAQAAKLADPDQTPSARVLAELREHGNSFAAFGLRQSEVHADYFRNGALLPAEQLLFDELTAASLADQIDIEQTQSGSFDDFVAAYRNSKACDN